MGRSATQKPKNPRLRGSIQHPVMSMLAPAEHRLDSKSLMTPWRLTAASWAFCAAWDTTCSGQQRWPSPGIAMTPSGCNWWPARHPERTLQRTRFLAEDTWKNRPLISFNNGLSNGKIKDHLKQTQGLGEPMHHGLWFWKVLQFVFVLLCFQVFVRRLRGACFP